MTPQAFIATGPQTASPSAPERDLAAALKQLMNYALALDNPPLLVLNDLRTIEIHTYFTG